VVAGILLEVMESHERGLWMTRRVTRFGHPSVLTLGILSVTATLLLCAVYGIVDVLYSFEFHVIYAAVWLAVCLPFVLKRPSKSKFGIYLITAFWISLLYFIPWTPRTRFLRDLDRVHSGMTRNEVESIMGKYVHGTGWPTNPFPNAKQQLADVNSGKVYSTVDNASGEMEVKDSIVYRHDVHDGRYNSDFGVVKFQNDRVVSVDFLPD